MLGFDQNDNAIEKYVTEEDYLEIPQKDYIHLGIAGKLESVYRFGKHFAAFAAITYSHDKKFWGRLNNTDSFTLVGDHAYGNNGHTSLVVKFIF